MIRYKPRGQYSGIMDEHEDGPFVLHLAAQTEIDALHAECDRLTAMLGPQASTPNGPESCEWLYCEEEDAWDTGCGHKFQIIEGSPKDNGLIYCHYCGKPIKECGE